MTYRIAIILLGAAFMAWLISRSESPSNKHLPSACCLSGNHVACVTEDCACECHDDGGGS